MAFYVYSKRQAKNARSLSVERTCRPLTHGTGDMLPCGCSDVGPLGAGGPNGEGTMDTQDDYHGMPEHLEELLLRTAEGDQIAFAEFYRMTSRRVFGLARRVVVDAGLSEEVLQETFITVWQQAAKYSPALGSPIGWLMTITHRRAVDKVRSHQRSAERDRRWAAANQSIAYDDVAEHATDRSDVRMLMESLSFLSVLQRESIQLAYFAGLTYRQVAERLGIPLPTVKTRIRDGLENLRTRLAPT